MNKLKLSVRLFQIVIANKCYECLTVSGEEGGRIGGREVERGWGRVGGSSGRADSTWRDSDCFSGALGRARAAAALLCNSVPHHRQNTDLNRGMSRLPGQ